MDFGLARLTQTDEQAATKTIEGMVMGTAAYMSPEQAKGKAVDKRADIWAFGAVLFELITGQRAFRGEDISDTILSVLRDQPDLSKVPPRIRKLLQRCLEKEPKERLRDIGEARFLLDEPKPFNPSDPARPRRIFGIVVTVLGILTAGMGFALYRATRPVDHPLMQFSVDLGPEAIAGQRSTVALSHDGRRIVFCPQKRSRHANAGPWEPNSTLGNRGRGRSLLLS